MNAEELIALNDEIAAMARAGLPLDQGLAALAREMTGDNQRLRSLFRWAGGLIWGVGQILFLFPDIGILPSYALVFRIAGGFFALFGIGLFVLGWIRWGGSPRLGQVTADLADDLRRGLTLPEALRSRSNQVPPYYSALVTAGIRTGRIGEVLATLTAYARSMATLRGIILDALFYPLIILALAVVLVGFLLIGILPQFEQMFKEFNMKLPAFTEAMLVVGRNPITLFFLPITGVVLFVLVTRGVMLLTPPGRRAWTRMTYTIPLIGTMMRAARLAAFTDLLSILVAQGVPLQEAFHLAGEASSDPLLSELADEVREALGQGQPLGEVLRGQGLIPEWVAWMAGLGEQRGQLSEALKQIAEMYRRQVEIRAGMLRSVLPPFLVIITAGVFVACFIFAMMLPMVKLLENLSK